MMSEFRDFETDLSRHSREGREGSEIKTLLPRIRYFLSSHLLYCINPHSTPDITFISPSPVLAVEEVLMASSWSLPQESNSLFTKSSWASVLRRERGIERDKGGVREGCRKQ
jgi:hypothetical protein